MSKVQSASEESEESAKDKKTLQTCWSEIKSAVNIDVFDSKCQTQA